MPPTVEVWPVPTRSFVLAMGLVIVARMLLAAVDERLQTVPTGELDTFVFGSAEAAYRLASEPTPEYVVLGTSRLFYLDANQLARRLGARPAQVYCLPLLPATFWSFAEFVERNPGLVRDARVVIIESLPNTLYESPDLFLRTTTTFLRRADFAERLLVTRSTERIRAVADWFLPAWSLRAEPVGWRVFLQQFGMSERERLTDFSTPGLTASVAAAPGALPRDARERVMVNHAPPPRTEPLRVRGLHELLVRIPAGSRIVFTVLPLRSDFAAAIERDPEIQRSFASYRRAIEGLEDSRVSFKWYDEDFGVRFADSDFNDPDHYSMDAIQTKLVELLANLIRSNTGPGRASLIGASPAGREPGEGA